MGFIERKHRRGLTGVDSYGADRGLHPAVPVDPLGYAGAMYRGGESTARRERYKRPFDLAVLALAGVGLLPLWLVLGAAIALAVRLESRGPMLYRQLRLGRGGRVFAMLKFRTMVEGAEAGTGPVWPSERDGRTTAVGRVLRRFHLDELPQVVHVLRGEMSLVGPRPERPELAERIERAVLGFGERLRVRPGIAGLAQARGADHMDLQSKLFYDRVYIATMGPGLDLKLCALCVWRALRPRRQCRTRLVGAHGETEGCASAAGQ